MVLSRRIELLSKLGEYIATNAEQWQQVKRKAYSENGWFIPEFVELATKNISKNYLDHDKLVSWTDHYQTKSLSNSKRVGVVMAGNIPLVGFHDFVSIFVTGHHTVIKPSSKDSVLIKHLVEVLEGWDAEVGKVVRFSEMLKDCDAYIATGSNNTSRYFEYYFGKYPHIIRRNKTSVAILNGHETNGDLQSLADDVYQFFGLGCRNVTKIFVPTGYDFTHLLHAFGKYNYLADHHKYKNNYDYNLAVNILNKRFYMTNGSILLIEDASIFSPISQLHYEHFQNVENVADRLRDNDQVQCIVGYGQVPFGQAQSPSLFEYADGVDTMKFLHSV